MFTRSKPWVRAKLIVCLGPLAAFAFPAFVEAREPLRSEEVTADVQLRSLASEIDGLAAAGFDAPIVRGDWFVLAATRATFS